MGGAARPLSPGRKSVVDEVLSVLRSFTASSKLPVSRQLGQWVFEQIFLILNFYFFMSHSKIFQKFFDPI